MQRNNQAQRMLTAALIFVASLATSTHITVVPFVLLFAFVMFRQLMYVSHLETVRSRRQHEYAEAPSGRAAGFYLAGSMAIGALLFPLLPRVRSPFMSGIRRLAAGQLDVAHRVDRLPPGACCRPTDPTIVARVWMDAATQRPFSRRSGCGPWPTTAMTRGEWRQIAARSARGAAARRRIRSSAVRRASTGEVIVQQKAQRGKLLMPVGAYSLTGMPSRLYEGPARDTYYALSRRPGESSRAAVRKTVEPLRLHARDHGELSGVARGRGAWRGGSSARRVRPEHQAALIEQYLTRNFRYVTNAGDPGKTVSIEDFLLRTAAGQCEYFAAGMVVLMTSLDVPARIAGGYLRRPPQSADGLLRDPPRRRACLDRDLGRHALGDVRCHAGAAASGLRRA